MSFSGIIEMDLRSLANEVKKKGALPMNGSDV